MSLLSGLRLYREVPPGNDYQEGCSLGGRFWAKQKQGAGRNAILLGLIMHSIAVFQQIRRLLATDFDVIQS